MDKKSYGLAPNAVKDMEQVIEILSNDPKSWPFRQPVDYMALGIPDYPLVVSQPMDLATVKFKVKSGAYCTMDECMADVRLIWKNAKTYNSPGSAIYEMANYMEGLTEKALQNLHQPKLTGFEFKKAISEAIKVQSPHKLQEVLAILIKNNAVKYDSQNEMEVDLDQLEPQTLNELANFLGLSSFT